MPEKYDKPAADNFKGIIEDYGMSKGDLNRGFSDGMHPNERKKDRWDARMDGQPILGETPEMDGGFLGRGRDWER